MVNSKLYLAPMEDVTDPAFRLLCKRFGASRVYTEFVNADALVRDVASTTRKLQISDDERPVAIQIYGRDPESMADAARIVEQAKPDFIDINFGCPVKKVAGKGAGAGLLKDIPKMLDITRAVVRAVNTPVTVKTRLGWDDNNRIITEIAEPLQDCGIAELAIHGRTRSQMYRGDADWSLIREVKNNPRIHIPIIGNGDVTDIYSAKKMIDETGCDGIMIGRAARGNPWIFKRVHHYLETGELLAEPSKEEVKTMILRHSKMLLEYKGEYTGIREMRKHVAWYTTGYKGSAKLRGQINELETMEQLVDLLERYRNMLGD